MSYLATLHLWHFTCLAGHWPVLWPFPQYLHDLMNLSLLSLPSFLLLLLLFLWRLTAHMDSLVTVSVALYLLLVALSMSQFVPSWWNLVSVWSLPFSFLNSVLRSMSLTARVKMSVILMSLADFLQAAQSVITTSAFFLKLTEVIYVAYFLVQIWKSLLRTLPH